MKNSLELNFLHNKNQKQKSTPIPCIIFNAQYKIQKVTQLFLLIFLNFIIFSVNFEKNENFIEKKLNKVKKRHQYEYKVINVKDEL